MLGRAGAARCGVTRCLAAAGAGSVGAVQQRMWQGVGSTTARWATLDKQDPRPPVLPALRRTLAAAVHGVPALVRVADEVGVGDGAGARAAGAAAAPRLILVLLKVLPGEGGVRGE